MVLTNYRGLNVEQMNHLRQRLREEKISYHVVKNTLMKLASKGTDLEKLNTYFEGPTAMAISYGDPVLLAKILSEFVKTQPSLEIKVGLIQGKVALLKKSKPWRRCLLVRCFWVKYWEEFRGQPVNSERSSTMRLQQVLGTIQARVDQLS